MRVLVLSSTFPSAQQPTRGVFVRERVRRLARRCEVVVVAPVPWFPLNRWVRAERDAVPACLALAGAVAGVRWNHLPPKVRADIRQRVKAVRA